MKKYLEKNPARSIWEPAIPEVGKYRFAVVVPVCRDREEFRGLVATIPCREDAFIVAVVNNDAGAPLSCREENQALLSDLRENSFQRDDLFFLDCATTGRELPGDGGVGIARKTGMDMVLAILGKRADALICSLDADTRVENNYFSAVAAAFDAHLEWGAATVQFHHRVDGENHDMMEAAVRLYEEYMTCYARKLAEIGSPYGYLVMGSAQVVRPSVYVRAGGMRKNRGGEDFYFFQAIRKFAPIGFIGTTTLHPAARLSDRVPFGTGPALWKLVKGEGLTLSSDAAFAEVGKVLRCAGREPEAFMALPEWSRAYLESEGFFEAWPRILRNTPKNDSARIQAFHVWFDALRTLKMLHFLGRHYTNFCPITLKIAVN